MPPSCRLGCWPIPTLTGSAWEWLFLCIHQSSWMETQISLSYSECIWLLVRLNVDIWTFVFLLWTSWYLSTRWLSYLFSWWFIGAPYILNGISFFCNICCSFISLFFIYIFFSLFFLNDKFLFWKVSRHRRNCKIRTRFLCISPRFPLHLTQPSCIVKTRKLALVQSC